MNKAYLISKSGGVFDNDYTEVGIFLDKQQAEEYVKEKNILYREQYKIYEQCEECYDDIVKLSNHPTHPSRGRFNKSGTKFYLTDFGMQNPNLTLFGTADGN